MKRRKIPIPEPPTHYSGEDGRINRVTFCGSLLKWKVMQPPSRAPPEQKRGCVTTFSKASRWRLLQTLAMVQWEKAKPCLFVTLTFPDDRPIHATTLSNQYRYLFLRHMENYLDKKIPAIWRMEWKPRLSGSRVGYVYPHFHLMVFGVKYIPYLEVNDMWRKALGRKGYVRTEVTAMRNEREAGSYVGKYCAKVEDPSLVNAAYLNSIPTGRCWGIHRKNILPKHQEQEMQLENNHLFDRAKAIAMQQWPDLKNVRDSFSLLGPLAVIIGRKLFGDFSLDTLTEGE